jgi:two-component system, OmpR family, alkaline phosphatase synthesis response regulator PhoP
VERSLCAHDLVLLDTVLPNSSGIDACSRLRRRGSHVPVIFVSLPAGSDIKHTAFEAGADDFIVRPLDSQELMDRVRAVLRRTIARADYLSCTIGPSVVNLATGHALRLNTPVSLTDRELELLRYLYQRRERVVPRTELLREVWRYNSTDTRTVEMHMAALRRKLEADPRLPRHLLTVRRRGYVFREREL